MLAQNIFAQVPTAPNPSKLLTFNLGGPRLGMTYIPGNTALYQFLSERNIGRTMSQFGWHFEYQVAPDIEGPAFVIEIVPLVGGVEYSTVIPSVSLVMGIRLPDGFEFGMGPNAIISDRGLKNSLVVAIGKSFAYGGVNIPINLSLATNPDGIRVSFIFGYSINTNSK